MSQTKEKMTETKIDTNEDNQDDDDDRRLKKFIGLRCIGSWRIVKYLGKGSFGTAFLVHHAEKRQPERALKIANCEDNNSSIQWESLVLRKLRQENRGENFVQLYDEGKVSLPYIAVNDDGTEVEEREKLYYMVVHLVDTNAIHNRIFGALDDNPPRTDQCMCEALKVAMQILKALYDLHSIGILHRDLKPDNLGALYPPNDKLVVLYDLGMARVYTDDDGALVAPRSFVGMRGTRFWASQNAERCREQGRVDDLWSWFYSLVEWMHRSYYYDRNMIRLPWDFREKKHRDVLKSPQMPASVMLRGDVSPMALYRINFMLRMLRPEVCPDYRRLAQALVDAHQEITDAPARFQPSGPHFALRQDQNEWDAKKAHGPKRRKVKRLKKRKQPSRRLDSTIKKVKNDELSQTQQTDTVEAGSSRPEVFGAVEPDGGGTSGAETSGGEETDGTMSQTGTSDVGETTRNRQRDFNPRLSGDGDEDDIYDIIN